MDLFLSHSARGSNESVEIRKQMQPIKKKKNKVSEVVHFINIYELINELQKYLCIYISFYVLIYLFACLPYFNIWESGMVYLWILFFFIFLKATVCNKYIHYSLLRDKIRKHWWPTRGLQFCFFTFLFLFNPLWFKAGPGHFSTIFFTI